MNEPRREKLLIVGTHHKTGTVWLLNVFRAWANASGRTLFNGQQADLPATADIFFQEHSHIDMDALQSRFPDRDLRGVHIIRDPRDVILSATHYHARSSEPWLHEANASFGGLSYQQKLQSLPDLTSRLIFEMENSSKWTIRAMAEWKFDDPRFFELRYEELIEDRELAIFSRAFTHLGATGDDLKAALKAAFENSLFSGKVVNATHVRSGRPQQWRSEFTEEALEKFNAAFGEMVERLGYGEG